MQNKKEPRIYIIGIGGKGLNGIAEFCMSKGYEVFGSDVKLSPEVISLKEKGAVVHVEQVADNMSRDVDVVIYSSIIKPDHPELRQARELGIRTCSRAEFLGEITRDLVRVSVAGSHGKSTTSALAALALQTERGSVNAITGAYVKELGSYQTAGSSPYCVLEACEYGKSFLHIPGRYTLLTSLEKSHMEFFGDEERMNDAFREFVIRHDADATLIINGDVPALREVCSSHTGLIVTCGFNLANDYVIRDCELREGVSRFSLYRGNVCIAEDVSLQVPGTYNILNASLVLVLLDQMGTGNGKFVRLLENFTGVGRRFEISKIEKTVFVDDFAHHPTQVRNLLKGLRQFFPDKNIVAVFEPRQFHLIRTFLKEYGKAFQWAHEVCVTDIVPALGDTETDVRSLNVGDVIKSVEAYSKPKSAWYAESYEQIAERLGTRDLSNAVVATIGAGSIYKVRDLLANRVQ